MDVSNWFSSDLQFNKLYEDPLTAQASMHWTPLHIARKAAAFLAAEDGKRIADIGSGGGKFCLAAAYYQPGCFFHGIEQRQNLVNAARIAQQTTKLQNVDFVHANIIETDLSAYDHFYFFNSFYEHVAEDHRIDSQLSYSKELYTAYNRYLFKQLNKKPVGTRLVTFHSTQHEIPPSYFEMSVSDDELLKCWIKV